jgi:ribosome modulation factor
MNVLASIPATVQIRRSRLLALIGVVAAIAAAMTWVALAFALGMAGERPLAGPSGALASSEKGALGAQRETRRSALDPLTPAERRSIGYYLFGVSGPLTPDQLQSVRDYWFGASTPLTPAQFRSIRHYLFGASASLTPAQLRSVREYWLGASASTGLP